MGTSKRRYSRRTALAAMAGMVGCMTWDSIAKDKSGSLRAGACALEITPQTLPVIVNGSFLERTADKVVEPIHARCLVLDDGHTCIAIAVVDNIGFSREMLDSVKEQVYRSTGIPTNRILISATHTHSAPSVIGALGSSPDQAYSEFLPPLLVEGIEKAAANREPAQVGWTVANARQYTNCRRWIWRPDRIGTDPFGDQTVRANMHPGYQNPDCIGPAGPVDPDLTILSVQSRDGRPIAMLANYCMHYYGAPSVSSDYYGPFCTAFNRLIGADKNDPPCIAMMSHGTSGDQHWMDYGRSKKDWGDRINYGELLAGVAADAYRQIVYRDDITLAMAERRLTLERRVPDEKRLAWAKDIMAQMGGRKPENRPEVYAREAVLLQKRPKVELKLQAVRIGDLGITAIPNEVYALTGLKLKAQSPLQPTMNIELANGCEGYIPPPEQHVLGGYNTWPARTAALEVEAEPRIVNTLLGLLEEVSDKPRRSRVDPAGPYVRTVHDSKPLAHWRMSEMAGRRALDAYGNRHGHYEDGVVFYLPGPEVSGIRGGDHPNRATHFAGGRMTTSIPELGDTYSVELWFWNGMPSDARTVTGYVFSRGPDGNSSCPGDHLGIGGTHVVQGRLLFYNGNKYAETLSGTTPIGLRTWNHVVMVRDRKHVLVYLNGSRTPEIASTLVFVGSTSRPNLANRVLSSRRNRSASACVAKHATKSSA